MTDFFQIMGLIIVAGLSMTLWLFRRGGVYNPSMPSLDREPLDEPFIPANPVIIAPDKPKQPVLLWDTPKQAFHSTRVLCDELGVSYPVKDEICYTIWGESEFHKGAIGKPNKNGSRDYGLCQYNDGKNAKGVPFWIGKGATFKDVDEVLNNPEKCVRVMIQTVKAGHIGWWYGHRGYTLESVKTSPMWALKS